MLGRSVACVGLSLARHRGPLATVAVPSPSQELSVYAAPPCLPNRAREMLILYSLLALGDQVLFLPWCSCVVSLCQVCSS